MQRSLGSWIQQVVTQCIAVTGVIICLVYLITPVTAHAQDTDSAPLGFRDCSFTEGQANAAEGTNPITRCIGSILRFVFVVALFSIAIRVATLALNNYNPFSNGDANVQTISMVWDVTIGLLLIGGPVIILSAINPALLNLDFIDQIGGIQSETPNSPSSTTSPTTGGQTPASQNSDVQGISRDQAQANVNTLNNPSGTVSTSSNTTAATTGLLFSFVSSINVNAQEEGSTIEEQLEAENTVRILLTVEQECYELLVPAQKKDECALFFAEYQSITDQLNTASRDKLTPINDTKNILNGSFILSAETTIRDIVLEPQKITNTACFLHTVILKSSNVMHSEQLYAIEICNNELPEQLFFQKIEGVIVPRVGEVLTSGSVLTQENQILYKL